MLTIRPLLPEDADATTALGRRAFASRSEQPDFEIELERAIARTWIAVIEEPAAPPRVVGYALGWLSGEDAELMSIAVGPEERGRGIGRALLSRFLQEMGEARVESVLLEVRASNAPARALYESLGFEPLGTRRRYYADGEDAWTYQLLTPARRAPRR